MPGLIENANDLFDLPLASSADGVLTVSDIADVRRTFKDATRYAYANGSSSISLNVMKRNGANLVEAMTAVDQVVTDIRPSFPLLSRCHTSTTPRLWLSNRTWACRATWQPPWCWC